MTKNGQQGEPDQTLLEDYERAMSWRMGWRKALKKTLRYHNISTRELGREAQVGTSFVSDLLSGRSDPTLGKLMRIAIALDITLGELLEPSDVVAIGRTTRSACVLHCDDGDVVEVLPDIQCFQWREGLGGLRIDGCVPVLVGSRILEPRFSEGDVAIGRKMPLPLTEQVNGKTCVIESKDGHRFLRVVHVAADPLIADLVALDPRRPILKGIPLAWAAPVVAVLKGVTRTPVSLEIATRSKAWLGSALTMSEKTDIVG